MAIFHFKPPFFTHLVCATCITNKMLKNIYCECVSQVELKVRFLLDEFAAQQRQRNAWRDGSSSSSSSSFTYTAAAAASASLASLRSGGGGNTRDDDLDDDDVRDQFKEQLARMCLP
jgi:hypothetical protein